MKNAQVLGFIFVTSLMISVTAMSATSGQLLLQGEVLDNTSIVVNSNGSNLNLNILGGENNKVVGSAVEQSNNLDGYSVIISSSTNGELRHTVDATKKTTYQVRYDGGSAVTPTSSGVVVKSSGSLSGATTDTSSIAVDVTAFASAPAGIYQDQLTISIVAD